MRPDALVVEPALDALEQDLELGLAQQGGLHPALHRLVADVEQEPDVPVVVEAADPQAHVVPSEVGEAHLDRERDRAPVPAGITGRTEHLQQLTSVVGVHQRQQATAHQLVVGEAAHRLERVGGEPAARPPVDHEGELRRARGPRASTSTGTAPRGRQTRSAHGPPVHHRRLARSAVPRRSIRPNGGGRSAHSRRPARSRRSEWAHEQPGGIRHHRRRADRPGGVAGQVPRRAGQAPPRRRQRAVHRAHGALRPLPRRPLRRTDRARAAPRRGDGGLHRRRLRRARPPAPG